MWVGSERSTLCTSANEEPDSFVNNAPLTGYEPQFFDDYHFSKITEIFIQESSSDSRPSNLHDSEISDYHCGKHNYSFDALQVYCFGINLKLTCGSVAGTHGDVLTVHTEAF